MARSCPRLRWLVLAVALLAALAATPAAATQSTEAPRPPANDEVANAQPIEGLPTTLHGTTVGATLQSSEQTGSCGGGSATKSSVWYTLRGSPDAAQRLAVELQAQGNLEATVAVFRVVRSQLQEVACETTDETGTASLTFQAAKNAVYDIRVAALSSSQLAGFTLNVFLPTPAVKPPGAPLPRVGASGHVDRIQDVNAAYSLTMHAGVSYIIEETTFSRHGACVTARLYPPGTRSFEGAAEALAIRCGGYRLFTPGPGTGGRYTIELTPDGGHVGEQRFHVQAAPAGPDETAPGIALGNYGVARAHLNGAGVQVLRLYRLDVTSHSKLTLRLRAPRGAHFDLMLVGVNGEQLACSCGGSGAQTLQQKLTAGRYYAAVLARGGTAGTFALERESRTITQTAVYFADARARAGVANASLGRATPIHVRVRHASAGPVTLELERFDPLFGWQFYRQLRARLSGGVASIAFTAPAVGRWRVDARYEGTRVSSPSRIGFSYLLVN